MADKMCPMPNCKDNKPCMCDMPNCGKQAVAMSKMTHKGPSMAKPKGKSMPKMEMK